jgi:hypothetical protein
MRLAVGGSTPFYLGNESGNSGSVICSPQIVEFDIYYTEPLLVGFQVAESEEEDCIGNFFAELVIDNC